MSETMHPRKRKWTYGLIASAMGIAVSALVFCAVEYGFYLANASRTATEHIAYSPPGEPNEFRLILGYRPRGTRTYTATKTCEDTVVYEVQYTIDEHHRRAYDTIGERFLAVFGGSFAFGEGVNDSETFAAQLADRLPERRTYTFGYSGYGSQHALVQISYDETWAGVEEETGDGIYILIPHHFMRAAGSMRVMTGWGRHFPAYRLDGGALVHEGTFEHARPWRDWFYPIVAREQILRYANVDWPLAPREQDIELTAALLAAARDALRERGGEHFAVVLYPSPTWNAVDMDTVRHALLNQDLDVVDYTADFALAEMTIPGDGHPNAEAFAYLADHLISFLPWLNTP